MSIPYLQLDTARRSIGFPHDGPRTFRSSDTTSINIRESISYKGPKKIANNIPNPEGPKSSEASNLISTLQQLEEKLKKAQKFLQNKRSEKDLLTLKTISTKEKGGDSGLFCEKYEDSTINL
jgi:hypothetical protein